MMLYGMKRTGPRAAVGLLLIASVLHAEEAVIESSGVDRIALPVEGDAKGSAAEASVPDAPPDSISPFLQRVQAAFQVLRDENYTIDLEDVELRMFDILVMAADNGGRILDEKAYQRLKNRRSGQTFDLGIHLFMSNGIPVVTGFREDSPAPEAGIEVGNVLEAIEGESLTNSYASLYTGLMRVQSDAPVQVWLRDDEGKRRELDLTPVLRQLPPVESEEALPFDLGYIRLNGLYPGAGSRLIEQLSAWKDENFYGAILDLRGAEGNDLESVNQIGSRFSDEGSMLYAFRDLTDKDLQVVRAAEVAPLGLPLMVLINNTTSGAAGVLAAVLRESANGAMLIGGESDHDLLVRDLLGLPEGRKAYVVTQKLVLANGKSFKGLGGVKPDIEVLEDKDGSPESPGVVQKNRREITEEESKSMEDDKTMRERVRYDPVLRRAVDMLLGLKALDIRGEGDTANLNP